MNENITDPAKKEGLTNNDHHATVTTKLATRGQRYLELITHSSTCGARGLLIELPGVLLATFLPILENIQHMQWCGRLPFEQWILSEGNRNLENGSQYLKIPPPLYARKPDFRFSLRSILKDSTETLTLAATTQTDDDTVINELVTRTSLDRGQCHALIAAPTREFALIQGPPGIGKSFLGVHLMSLAFLQAKCYSWTDTCSVSSLRC